MKRFFKLMAIALLIVLSCTSSFALDMNITQDEGVITEVIFEPNTTFTDFQKQNIINHFTGVTNNTVTTQNILCLFGHDFTTERCEYIRHYYYTSFPKCLLETYDVSICSRCSYVSSKFISSIRIGCCS